MGSRRQSTLVWFPQLGLDSPTVSMLVGRRAFGDFMDFVSGNPSSAEWTGCSLGVGLRFCSVSRKGGRQSGDDSKRSDCNCKDNSKDKGVEAGRVFASHPSQSAR